MLCENAYIQLLINLSPVVVSLVMLWFLLII
jgi:hypothetical protein